MRSLHEVRAECRKLDYSISDTAEQLQEKLQAACECDGSAEAAWSSGVTLMHAAWMDLDGH